MAIAPVINKDSDNKIGVLFVLPWLRRETDQCIEDIPGFEQFFKIVKKVIPGFAVISLKQTPGMWKDDVVLEKIRSRRHVIDEAIDRFKPGVVVFLGVNFAKYCVPEYKASQHNILCTFSTYVKDDKKNVPCFAWMLPDKVLEDPYEFVRMPENLGKLWFLAKKKHYERKPTIENLDTYKSAAEYIDFLAHEHKGRIGFDTETYSLNRVHHTRLGSMQFCTDAFESRVLLWDSKHQAMSRRELDKLRPKLVTLFGSPDTSFDSWIMHNNQFDEMQVRGAFGVRMPKPTYDTLMFAYLMDESRKYNTRLPISPGEGPYSLKILVKEFLAFFHYNSEAMKARSDGTLMELPLQEFLDYSGYDPIVTWRMFDVFLKWAKLEKYDAKVMNLMLHLCSPASKMYADMSYNGMHVDGDKLKKLLSKNSVINARIAAIKEEYKAIPEIIAVNKELFHEEAQTTMCFKVPWVFNMKKDAHKKALFFHSKNGYKLGPNKDGKFSTDKKFQKLHDKNPAVKLLKESNGLLQLRNLYIKPIFETMFAHPDPKADTCDGRVHQQVRMHGTVTGRPTIQHPNTAQIPRSDTPEKKEIKALFSPEPGKVYMQCDLASAEVRVWGAMSEDENICRLSQEAFDMLKLSRENPEDKKLKEDAELKANFHKQTYALCYNIKPEVVTPGQRQIAKNTTFGITYGMSDNGLAAQLGLPVEEAIEIKRIYFSKYVGGKRWLDNTIKFAHENGYVETPMGRRRRLPQIFTGDRKFMSEAERYATNMPIQGTASDYAMLATMLLNKAIIEQGIEGDVKLINGVYDSAVVEVTATVEWVERVAKLMRKIFTVDVNKYIKKHFDFTFKAPIDIDIEVSQWKMFKCRSCGNKWYPGEGKVCKAKLKTGKKLENGDDETKPCGCKDIEVVHTNAGWGFLTALEENKQGYMKAAKGF